LDWWSSKRHRQPWEQAHLNWRRQLYWKDKWHSFKSRFLCRSGRLVFPFHRWSPLLLWVRLRNHRRLRWHGYLCSTIPGMPWEGHQPWRQLMLFHHQLRYLGPLKFQQASLRLGGWLPFTLRWWHHHWWSRLFLLNLRSIMEC